MGERKTFYDQMDPNTMLYFGGRSNPSGQWFQQNRFCVLIAKCNFICYFQRGKQPKFS